MTDKLICEKCGAEMVDRSVGASICIECPKCGWGWATTTYDLTDDDHTSYEIWLAPGNPQSLDVIRLIADIANINFVQAKRTLASEKAIMIYKAHPEAVAEMNMMQRTRCIAQRLFNAGLRFSILPDFPYDYH